jgi:hypothetical protein
MIVTPDNDNSRQQKNAPPKRGKLKDHCHEDVHVRASAHNNIPTTSWFSAPGGTDWEGVVEGWRDLLAVGTNNMDDTFERACRDADRKPASRPEDPRILRARRLLADDVSYERAYAEFMRERPTSEATVDALVYSLRRGIAELTRPDILRRLSELDKGQLKAICRRLQNFKPEIAPPWSPEDVAALIAKWRELHG